MAPRKINVTVQTTQEMSLEDFAMKVSGVVKPEHAAKFIAMLDELYENWDVTEAIMNHFDHVKENSYKTDFEKMGLETKLKPKNLLEP